MIKDQNRQTQETTPLDYDSYSSDDGNNNKNKKKNANVHLGSNIAKANIKNRTSAPNLIDNRLTLQQAEKNQKITEKLYMPFIKDKSYKIEVNNNLTKIKDDSKNSAIFSHKLNKKKEEVDKIGKQLMIYNNPSIFNLFYLLFIFCFLGVFLFIILNKISFRHQYWLSFQQHLQYNRQIHNK